MENIKKDIQQDLENVQDIKTLNDLKVKYIGKKGIITELYSKRKEIPNEEKKEYGKKINELKNMFNDKYEEIKTKLEQKELEEKLANEKIDVTLPGTKIEVGAPNILEKIIEELE